MIPAITGKTAMLADSREVDPNVEYVMEPKYDGHRILAVIGPHALRGIQSDVTLYARSGVDKTRLMPNIVAELRGFPAGTVLDGEVVHWTDTGGDWAKVQSILGSDSKAGLALTYVVFDCLAIMGEDVRLHPQHVRREFIETLIGHPQESEHIRLTEQHAYDPDIADMMMADGWEGAILKPVNGAYRAGRHTGGWLKIKSSETEDVVVIGATEGKGRLTGQIGALIFGQYRKNGDLATNGLDMIELGQCSGMTDERRDEFTQMRDAGTLAGLVIEVRHMGKHPTGGWKSPQFKRIRTDKLAVDCIAGI